MVWYNRGVRIEWHTHAKQRVRERGIELSRVLETIRAPQQVIGSGVRQTLQRQYVGPTRRNTYLLRVFVEVHGDVTLVRSVYRTSKIGKYWRDDA